MSEFSRYLDAREHNRKRFAESNQDILKTFDVAFRASQLLGEVLTTQRDFNGNSHISLTPFFLIFQRQTFAAFEALSANQAYQAWVGLRPGIESVLIMGKWVKDPKSADVWSNRFRDPKPYRQAYQGKPLGDGSLPRGPDIQAALASINDYFLHPNPEYYFRHLAITDLDDGNTELKLEFFDDPEDVALGLLGILHLVIVAQDNLAQMFGKLFPDSTPVEVGLVSFEHSAKDWVTSLRKSGPFYDNGLTQFGLWPAPVAD